MTITGTGFTGATAVKFGLVDASTFTVESDTEITAVAPEAYGGAAEGHEVVYVTVTGPGGTSAEATAARFSWTPIIDQVKPAFGPATGGMPVKLYGFGLEETSAVHFGSAPAESFVVNPDGSITAIPPPMAAHEPIVAVTATTPEGVTKDFWLPESEPANYFTYGPTVTGVTPEQGPQAGGTVVTIHGTGFKSPLYRCFCGVHFVHSISFGAATLKCGLPGGTAQIPCSPVEFEVKSDTEITVTVPPGVGTVPVAVHTDGGTSPADPAAQFSYSLSEPPLGLPLPDEPQRLKLLNCVVSKGSGNKASGACSIRSVSAAEHAATTGPVRVRLYRGQMLYAKGTARVHRRTTHLFLNPLKRVKPGRYELVLSRQSQGPNDGSRWPRRERIVIR